MITTRVSVTGTHIEDGKPCNGEDCPLALALLEALAAEGVTVVRVQIEVDCAMVTVADADGHREFRAALPPEATAFVEHFDDKNPVEPFTFVLTWREVIAL